MPAQTNSDKIDELGKWVAALSEGVKALGERDTRRIEAVEALAERTASDLREASSRWQGELRALEVSMGKDIRRVEGAIHPLRTDVTVLRRDVDEAKKSREEWSRRAWSLVVPAATAVIGALLGYFLKR